MEEWVARIGTDGLYALIVLAAALAALAVMAVRRRRYGLKPGTTAVFGILAVLLGFLFGRLGYCLVSLSYVMGRDWAYFNQMNLNACMFYGAAAGVGLAGWLTGLLMKEKPAAVLDAAAAPAALLTAVGRFAETLIERGYGESIEDWFDPMMERSMIALEDTEALCRWPFAYELGFYQDWRFSIFLWEAVGALVIFGILLGMKKRRDGAAAVLFLLLYAGMQTTFESMRRDDMLCWSFVKVSQLLSGILVLLLAVLCWARLPAEQRKPAALIRAAALVLVCCGVIMAMEFALEQKILFLMWMRADVCYALMAAASLGLIFSVLPLWRRGYPETA